ncbi:hypothetical protein AGMMS49942_19830 [Spirochaetia bacterium]|nr:hypothetical protein AGMMS49942_19830 [Spirochaetia bacterium]
MNPTGKGGLKERPHQINRKGRPKKGSSFADALRYEVDQMKEQPDGKGKELALRGPIAKKVLELATNGDIQAIKLVAAYLDGLPRQGIDTNITGSMDISIGSPPALDEADFPE